MNAVTVADAGVLETAALFLSGGGEDDGGMVVVGARDCMYTFTVMFFGIKDWNSACNCISEGRPEKRSEQ